MKKFKKIVVILACLTLVIGSIMSSFSMSQWIKDAGKWAVKTTGKRVMDNWCGFGSKDILLWSYIKATGALPKDRLSPSEIQAMAQYSQSDKEDECYRLMVEASKLSDPDLLKFIMDNECGVGSWDRYCKRHKIKNLATIDTNALFGDTSAKAPTNNATSSQNDLLAQYQAALAKQQKTANTPSQEELLAQYYAALAKQQQKK